MGSVIALGACIVVVLTGCAASGPARPGSTGAIAADSTTDGSEWRFSPLEAFMAFGQSPAERAVLFDAQDATFEALLAQCMADAGFEYYPVRREPFEPSAVSGASPPREIGSGWGIVGDFGDAEWIIEEVLEPVVVRPDANADYVAALSPSARASYQAAFSGSDEQPGCRSTASSEAFGPSDYVIPEELSSAMADLESRIENDDRVVAALRQWRECMNGKGLDYAAPEDIPIHIQEQLSPILAAASIEGLPSNEAFEQLLASDPQAAFDAVRSGVSIDRAALADLRALEIRASDADIECGVNLQSTMRDVRWALEDEFIATHEAALVEARAGLNPK